MITNWSLNDITKFFNNNIHIEIVTKIKKMVIHVTPPTLKYSSHWKYVTINDLNNLDIDLTAKVKKIEYYRKYRSLNDPLIKVWL